MNAKNCELSIEIIYDNKKCNIGIDYELMTFEKFIQQCMKEFKIKEEDKNYIIFTYKDEQEDINIIENKEDIFKNSKEISPNKYFISIYLQICKYDLKINNDIDNKEKIDNNKNNNLEQNKELIKELEEKNSTKDKKIKELENEINKLKLDIKIISNKIIFEKSLIKNILSNININKNNEKNDNKNSGKENLIIEINKEERKNFSNEIKNFKDEIILEMKKELEKDKIKYDNIINNINDIKLNYIDNIKADLSFIK